MSIIEEWKRKFHEAKTQAYLTKNIKKFKGLHKEQSQRASYFVEMEKLIQELGISNPHEKSALSIEPTHPVQHKYMDREFAKLNNYPPIIKDYKKYKLTLISLEMIKQYSPNSDAIHIINSGKNSPLYLLDNLYGFVFLPEKNKIANHCLAIDTWKAHLKTMPTGLSKKLWEKRADNMLSGGAFAARILLKNIIPDEPDRMIQPTPPVIQVDSEEELFEFLEKLRDNSKHIPDMKFWFRGQNKDYLTPDRKKLSLTGITPYCNIRDSDFTPSLYRHYDSFIDSPERYEDLVLELAKWTSHANQILSPQVYDELIRGKKGVASVDELGLKSYQKGLILQQYGAPSAYLDITSDVNVAIWFATNKCNMQNNKMSYDKYQFNYTNSSPEDWPTIFIFPLVKGIHPHLNLNEIFSNFKNERPARQKCGLLGGAGNLARNYCARYLGIKVRLGPNFKSSSQLKASDLFPNEKEDYILKYLKNSDLSENKLFPVSEIKVES
ncbi:hypothetical protein L8O47_00745 [Enterobacter roggenkampii]|uniref:hypothetical protein n=1 Tax=Enterobacter roggenkampii TaxID=1812935 RepID=UPI0020058663|nr:hypothetical protein [Enterobacter roggenkampii]MCK7149447.1 hypothetical protein [Enterobacter roggenkampii]